MGASKKRKREVEQKPESPEKKKIKSENIVTKEEIQIKEEKTIEVKTEKQEKIVKTEKKDELPIAIKVKLSGISKSNKDTPTYQYESYDVLQHIDGWKEGKSLPYSFLANVMDEISKTQSRIKKIELLCNCFRTIIVRAPDELLPAVYLSTNQV